MGGRLSTRQSILPSQLSVEFLGDDGLEIRKTLTKEGHYYQKNGEFSDVWRGILIVGPNLSITVSIKVLRGAPAHNIAVHEQTKEECVANVHRSDLSNNDSAEVTQTCYGFGYLPSMVTPWCPNGNILEYIQSQHGKADILQLLLETITGLEYLHSKDVIHGDLRAANILISDGGEAMLADFGVTFVIDHSEFTTNKIAGPARWTAPEILDPPDDEESEPPYSFKSDIFAYAMTAVEVCEGTAPFRTIKNDSTVIFQILKGTRPQIPALLKENNDISVVIERCWSKEVDHRPTATEVKEVFKHAAGVRRSWYRLFVSLIVAVGCAALAGITHWVLENRSKFRTLVP